MTVYYVFLVFKVYNLLQSRESEQYNNSFIWLFENDELGHCRWWFYSPQILFDMKQSGEAIVPNKISEAR